MIHQDDQKNPKVDLSEGLASQPDRETASSEGDLDGAQGQEVERLTQEVNDLKDKYIRAVAEMENMRRRMDRERGELVKFSLENILKDLLPTLDSLEKALPDTNGAAPAAEGNGESGYYEGMLMVKKQLLDVLRRHGLEVIRAKGEAFDPNIHQAIQRIESAEVEKDQVSDEYARGYLLHGRLLRPAIVSVLTPAGG